VCAAAIGRREAVIDRQAGVMASQRCRPGLAQLCLAGVYMRVCLWCLRGLQSARMMSRSGAVLGLLVAAIDR